MKSLLLLTQEVLKELGTWCCTSTARDQKTIASRYEHEGVSFLTITLPSFCKDLEKGLEEGKVTRNSFPGFQKRAELPNFLGGFLELVFDRVSGLLLDDPSDDAIFALRQILLLHKKVEIDCSEERKASALEGYIKCEQEVRFWDSQRTPEMVSSFSRVSQMLWSGVLQEVDELVFNLELTPKHGPGATADSLRGNSKYDQIEWPRRLERAFPYGDYVLPSWRYYTYLDRVNFLEPGDERPAKVVLVPKTLKTPRIIAEEPTAMQYMQQAILRPLVLKLESAVLSKGQTNPGYSFVGFRQQSPNKEMAELGSITGTLGTLDLSEASDRVSNQLVREMLRFTPNLAEGVDACRSRKADVDGKVIRLAKFASMGSALCFPFEAMVFTTIIFLGIERELSKPLTHKDLSDLRGRVRVYGDDIVVPVEYVQSVIAELEAFGLKVNRDKSFWTGRFRESCGGDYYNGADVTPVRCKQVLPHTLRDVTEIVSTVALRNRFYKRGMWQTTRFLDRWITKVIRHFPTVEETSSVLGRHSFLGYGSTKVGGQLQTPLVKGYVTVARPPSSHLEDVGALQKFFLTKAQTRPSTLPVDWMFPESSDDEHLERFGRPDAVGIKLRLARPY